MTSVGVLGDWSAQDSTNYKTASKSETIKNQSGVQFACDSSNETARANSVRRNARSTWVEPELRAGFRFLIRESEFVLLFGLDGPVSAEDTLPDDLGLPGSEAKHSLGGLAPFPLLELGPHDTPVRVSWSNEQVSDF